MKRVVPVIVIVLIGVAGLFIWRRGTTARDVGGPAATSPAKIAPAPPKSPALEPPRARLPETGAGTAPETKVLSAEAKAERIAKIAKDYEEIMTKAASEFSLLGAAFPGGFSAYLRQLAMLEREKWEDYAAVLTPAELEELQLREHNAGKLVQKWLGDSGATLEQRRAVFRMQREFDDKYALIFDLTPASLVAREAERQALQEKILGVLGPGLFAPWLRGEGQDFGRLTQYVERNALRTEAALEVWRIKNEYTRRRLEITAQGSRAAETASLQAALAYQTRARVIAVLGPAAGQAPAASGVSWLPPAK